jgi:hypothetical protein
VRADERLVRMAARMLPRSSRDSRREEWLADLEGAAELGIPRRDVSLGALRFALTEPSLREHLLGIRPRTWVIGGSLAVVAVIVGVPVALVSGYVVDQVRGVVTEEVAPDGARETVHWKDYPGVPDLTAGETLAGPSLEDGLRDGDAIIREIEAALTAEFGLTWADRQAATSDSVFPAENYFGGTSMLYGINLPEAASEQTVSGWDRKERVLEIASTVLAKYDFGPLVLDQERVPTTGEEAVYAYGSTDPAEQAVVATTADGTSGQWFNVTITDSMNDPTGRFDENGWTLDSISLFYGANALLPAADRAAFEERARQFSSFALPEPLEP